MSRAERSDDSKDCPDPHWPCGGTLLQADQDRPLPSDAWVTIQAIIGLQRLINKRYQLSRQ